MDLKASMSLRSPCFIQWETFQSQNQPTDFNEEALKVTVINETSVNFTGDRTASPSSYIEVDGIFPVLGPAAHQTISFDVIPNPTPGNGVAPADRHGEQNQEIAFTFTSSDNTNDDTVTFLINDITIFPTTSDTETWVIWVDYTNGQSSFAGGGELKKSLCVALPNTGEQDGKLHAIEVTFRIIEDNK